MGEIKENTFLHIFLKDWAPALITTLVGGVLVAVLLPRCQADFEQTKAHQVRRLAIVESTAKNFTTYLVSWQRLRDMAALESSRGSLTKEQTELKKSIVAQRNEALLLLFSDLDTAKLYFKPDAVEVIRQFQEWDRRYSKARLAELPPLEEWEQWKEKVLGAMLREANTH